MDVARTELGNILDGSNFEVIETYQSRKNSVTSVRIEGQLRVIKIYSNEFANRLDHEHTILQEAKELGVKVPEVFKKTDTAIIMEYIPGEVLIDTLNSPQIHLNEKRSQVKQLTNWFVKFHTGFKRSDKFLLRSDCNLRNFILGTGSIYGIDFEEATWGVPVQDIGVVCSAILDTDPMFTDWKVDLCRLMIDRYSMRVDWSLDNIEQEIAKALEDKVQWRPQHAKLLTEMAGKIKRDGLSGI
jgi:tRNA A-37 threonylcarbamoyl transferase component Bud32